MAEGPDNLVLALLRDMRAGMKDIRADMATKSDIADVRSEMHSLRADVASDIMGVNARIDATGKELSEQIVGLRRAVVEYHFQSSATGCSSANSKRA